MGIKLASMTQSEERGRSPGERPQLPNTPLSSWWRGASAGLSSGADSGSAIHQLGDLEQLSSSWSQSRQIGQRLSGILSKCCILQCDNSMSSLWLHCHLPYVKQMTSGRSMSGLRVGQNSSAHLPSVLSAAQGPLGREEGGERRKGEG